MCYSPSTHPFTSKADLLKRSQARWWVTLGLLGFLTMKARAQGVPAAPQCWKDCPRHHLALWEPTVKQAARCLGWPQVLWAGQGPRSRWCPCGTILLGLRPSWALITCSAPTGMPVSPWALPHVALLLLFHSMLLLCILFSLFLWCYLVISFSTSKGMGLDEHFLWFQMKIASVVYNSLQGITGSNGLK